MIKNFIIKFLLILNKYDFFNKLFSIFKQIENYEKIIFKNKSIYFLNTNKTTNYRIKTFFSKEPETLQWINSFNNGDVFWDIGANVGLYSIYSQFVNKKIETIAFEPSVLNLEILVKNINKNNLQNKISIITNPIYDKTTIENFNLSTLENGGANSNFGVPHSTRNTVLSYRSNSLNFENLFDFYKIKYPDHVKIDVDGNELPILKSLCKSNNHFKSILLEFNENNEELKNILEENKFKNVFNSNTRNNQIWERS